LIVILAINAFAQFRNGSILPDPVPAREEHPGAGFQMASGKYRTFGGAGSHGIRRPWWAIDYPYADIVNLVTESSADGFLQERGDP
jgi:hypothetical protein